MGTRIKLLTLRFYPCLFSWWWSYFLFLESLEDFLFKQFCKTIQRHWFNENYIVQIWKVEACPGLFSPGADYFFRGGRHQEQKCTRRARKHFLPFLKRFCSWGITHKKEGAEYFIITKVSLVLASAPSAPHESFFTRGTNILFPISSGEYTVGAYAPYAPWLDMPLMEMNTPWKTHQYVQS